MGIEHCAREVGGWLKCRLEMEEGTKLRVREGHKIDKFILGHRTHTKLFKPHKPLQWGFVGCILNLTQHPLKAMGIIFLLTSNGIGLGQLYR